MLSSIHNISMLIFCVIVLFGCTDNEFQAAKLSENAEQSTQLTPNEKIELKIERKVQLSHPNIDLGQYVRFFTYSKDAKLVLAQYIINYAANGEMVFETGKSVWTAETNWPRMLDGGCAVINIKHELKHGGITDVWCNGSA